MFLFVTSRRLVVMFQRLVVEYGLFTPLFPPTNISKLSDYYLKTTEESFNAVGKPTSPFPKHGNMFAMHLTLDGLRLQPCLPSYFARRSRDEEEHSGS